ncbi:hypothetical protein J6590_055288 [Homalodisca vitripennis]|nr:hypothetical protein J6590_055288 [Homalodisca vitripennis]
MRILAGCGPGTQCRNAFKELKILTVVALFIIEGALYAYKQNLSKGTDIHMYNTRAANNYTLQAQKLTIFKKPQAYLISDVKRTSVAELQEKKLTKWLLDRPYYTIEEFEH